MGALSLVLRLGGLRLEPREVREAHLQQPQHATGVRLHAPVRRPGPRVCLQQRGCAPCVGLRGRVGGLGFLDEHALGGLVVEFSEHLQGSLDGRLPGLGVLDRLCVRGLLLRALRDGLRLLLRDLRDRIPQLRDVLRQHLDVGRELLGGGRELLGLGGLVVARLLIGGELRVAEGILVRLLVGLLHQLHDQIFDHLLDFDKGVLAGGSAVLHECGDAGAELRERLGVLFLRQPAHELDQLRALQVRPSAQLRRGARLLQEGIRLIHSARARLRQNLFRLGQRLELSRAARN
mmetsp:Transcript_68010/g.180825  ORF Transcript_68010/g.180825 Transcript_68010/m.180825 type:complete len:291 (+) Transcript_68010:546-1418(+)